MLPFFRKKPAPEPAPAESATPAERRRHYRVPRQNLEALALALIDSRGNVYPASCEDLSLGGAALCFAAQTAPRICRGQEVEIQVQSQARETAVRARARIAVVVADAHVVRCGVMFLDERMLEEQLDAFHSRLFNRRRHARVLPELDQRVMLKVRWDGGEVEVRAHDFSAGGAGATVGPEALGRLRAAREVTLDFPIPGTKRRVTARARLASVRELARGAMVGFEFLPEGGIERSRAELESFIEQRIAEMSHWNAAQERKTA